VGTKNSFQTVPSRFARVLERKGLSLSLKVFISGATGFVGRHLIDLLSSREHEICGTSFPDEPENDDRYGGKNISYLDIRSEEEVFETIERMQPDWIFHLAAVSNVRHSWEQRRETWGHLTCLRQ
jgi:GDP-4-dehydro-6-deoxy-D-mannose reductase